MSFHTDTEYNIDVEELFHEYSDMVYKIALVQMKNKNDTEDILQEVFLRLVKYSKKLESKEHAKAWLIRVTQSCCKQHYLSSWYKNTTALKEELPTKELFNEQESILYEAVMELPLKYRTAIHLYYYEGYSVSELAKVLNKKENTIKSHLFRARSMLKDTLKGGVDFE